MTSICAYFSSGTPTYLPQKKAGKENDVAASASNAKKGEAIFHARAPIRDKIRTEDKIKLVVAVILILIGIGALIAGFVLIGVIGGLPFATPGLLISGEVLGLAGCLLMQTKRILKDEEEKHFWDALSGDSLSELTSKRWNWYCVGSPYYGAVKGVCNITYSELQDHGLMSRESAKTLQNLLGANKQLEESQAREFCDLEKISPELITADAREKIAEKYREPALKLRSEFEEFRNAFIHEAYKIHHANRGGEL